MGNFENLVHVSSDKITKINVTNVKISFLGKKNNIIMVLFFLFMCFEFEKSRKKLNS